MSPRQIELPMSESVTRSLHVGEMLSLHGRIRTARDAVHRHLAGGAPAPCSFQDGVIYHCGPVIVADNGGWRVTAAGPTTSAREEPYMATLIERFGIRGIIGKGGMGEQTLRACREFGCVYMHAVGGAAQVLAAAIKRVENVFLLEEFGAPEAVWDLVVEAFPVLVTMDASGESLHEQVRRHAEARRASLTRAG